MSLGELQIIAEKENITVAIEKLPSITVQLASAPGLSVIVAGNVGPPGPQGKWDALTQMEYDALDPPNPDTLYVIIE